MSDTTYDIGAPPPRRRRDRAAVSPLIAASRVQPTDEPVLGEPAAAPEASTSIPETAQNPAGAGEVPTAAAAHDVLAVPETQASAVGGVQPVSASTPVFRAAEPAAPAPAEFVSQPPAQPVVTPAPEPVVPTPQRQKAEPTTWKKTIAFPVDLWRYAGTVHNATAGYEDEMYFQEFVWAAIRREIERREREYNNGDSFQAPSRLRRGRRFGEQ